MVKNISDDEMKWGRSPDDYSEHLDEALTRIEKHRLKINSKKCIFGATSLIFSSHKLSAYGISPDQKKLLTSANLNHQHKQ